MTTAPDSPWQHVGGSTAEAYQRDLVPLMFAPLAPLLVNLVNPGEGDRVLDVACGTGVVARLASRRVGVSGRVVGLDNNAAMLKIASGLPPDEGAVIEWLEASAMEIPFPDGTFDALLCQQGLQQFSDRPAALREMRRVLKPGGRLAASVWADLDENPAMAALVAALAKHVGDAAANNRRAPFRLSSTQDLRALLTDAHFDDVRIEPMVTDARFSRAEQFVNAQLAATPLTTLGALTADAHLAVVRDVTSALAPYRFDDRIEVPMTVLAAIARA